MKDFFKKLYHYVQINEVEGSIKVIKANIRQQEAYTFKLNQEQGKIWADIELAKNEDQNKASFARNSIKLEKSQIELERLHVDLKNLSIDLDRLKRG